MNKWTAYRVEKGGSFFADIWRVCYDGEKIGLFPANHWQTAVKMAKEKYGNPPKREPVEVKP